MARSLEERFRYHKTDESQQAAMGVVRDRCLAAAAAVAANTPDPECEQSIALLEQAMMIANAGIARGPS